MDYMDEPTLEEDYEYQFVLKGDEDDEPYVSELRLDNLDGYNLLEIIGEGSFGTVWKAEIKDKIESVYVEEVWRNINKSFDNQVAIKIMKRRNIQEKQLTNEYNLKYFLNNNCNLHLVCYYDVFIDEDSKNKDLILIMSLITGKELFYFNKETDWETMDRKTMDMETMDRETMETMNRETMETMDMETMDRKTMKTMDRETMDMKTMETIGRETKRESVSKKIMGREETYTKKEKKIITEQLLLAVKTLHSHDIFHRDIKPANIIYNKEKQYTTLIDYGFSCAMPQVEVDKFYIDYCLGIKGTNQYIDPRIVNIKHFFYDDVRKSDLYSLGIVLFQLWNDRHIFTELYNNHKKEDIEDWFRTFNKTNHIKKNIKYNRPLILDLLEGRKSIEKIYKEYKK